MPRLLQALELNGFKSFANKTTLDLSHGITAVVGPNGSGKSNVIDAIRWLLGERDARNLRGGKGEDLIFAGTRERARMGLAQATLYFSNDQKFFPADYPEIAVSRHISRDNTSRYFINKSEVRLKDLVDFFAQSRLGARGLVVVTQGNSDMFIRATPMERRAMIEEILGLREYQLKKSEAERRLEHATINLEKVRALTEELLPHLRSLKRQTSRWEKRAEVEQELHDLENQFYGSKLNIIQEKEVELLKLLEEKSKEKNLLDEAYKKAQHEVESVEKREPQERAELATVKQKTTRLQEDRSRLQKEIGKIEVAIEASKHTSSSTHPSTPELIKTLEEAHELLLASVNNTEELQSAVKKVINKIDLVLKKEILTEAKQDNNLSGELMKLVGSLDKLELDLKALAADEERLSKNQGQFYADFKAALAKLDSAKRDLDRWQESNQENIVIRERLSFQREELERNILQNGRRPDEFKSFKTANDHLDSLEGKMLKLRGQLASIGEIDQAILDEARTTEERYTYLEKELTDLEKSKADLKNLIRELKDKISHDFHEALNKINNEFASFFDAMFGGGYGKLIVQKPTAKKTKPADEAEVIAEDKELGTQKEAEEGIEIDLKLPRKKISSLEMLSGGERSLVGIAALFALISVSPPPFLVLDEVDAPLDERNARRFAELVKKFAHETQFVIVTHNRATMEAAEVLYGVTMNADGTSKIVSLKLE